MSVAGTATGAAGAGAIAGCGVLGAVEDTAPVPTEEIALSPGATAELTIAAGANELALCSGGAHRGAAGRALNQAVRPGLADDPAARVTPDLTLGPIIAAAVLLPRTAELVDAIATRGRLDAATAARGDTATDQQKRGEGDPNPHPRPSLRGREERRQRKRPDQR